MYQKIIYGLINWDGGGWEGDGVKLYKYGFWGLFLRMKGLLGELCQFGRDFKRYLIYYDIESFYKDLLS